MLKYIIASMRIQQWIKNFFIFVPLIFAGHLFIFNDLLLVTLAYFIFSLTCSAIYILNDIIDNERDKLHPEKSKRPIPSGKLKPSRAIYSAVFLVVLSFISAYLISYKFCFILIIYLLLNIFYSFWLKKMVILDVMTISFGFVLRVVAGAVIIDVPISEWLLICTLLLSLFLGFSKRKAELNLLEDAANSHRVVLTHYSSHFLDQMIGIVTGSTVISYALYTISEETVLKFSTKNLIYTVPFVLYGIFRYLYLVYKKQGGGNPTQAILTDIPIIINVLLWVIVSSIIIYWR